MLDAKPSRTAQRVALRRAAHQILDHPRVFDDPLAVAIAGESERPDSAQQPYSRALRAFIAVRSRYTEDQLARAVERGVRQYVLLGAGLDTFAYRNSFRSSGLQVFDGQLVGKVASSVVIGIPLVVLGRRFLPANRGDIVPA